MLHGWGSAPEVFAGLMAPLSQQRRILAPALPGFAGSPEPDSRWGTRDYAELLLRWLERQDIERTDLLGHSFGGRAAIALAADHPERVSSLTLIGSAGLVLPRSLKIWLRGMQARALKALVPLLREGWRQPLSAWRERLGSSDWRAASPTMKGVLSRVISEDLFAEIRRLTQPTLLLWGENDMVVPVAAARKMQSLIAGSRLEILSGAGHYCFLDRPGETLALVWEHLGLKKAW